MSNIYSNKELKKLSLIKDAQILKPLIINLKEEESSVCTAILSEEQKSKMDKLEFKKSGLFISKSQIYKSYSVYGIMNNFNRNIKYKIIDLSFLLDVWYNSSTIMNKDDLISPEILIIHGITSEWKSINKTEALLEIISTRKTMQKITWVFLENATLEKVDNLYPGVTDLLNKCYTTEF